MNSRITFTEPQTEVEDASRTIGRIDGTEDGPTIIIFAGIHGNEPAGIDALNNLFANLEDQKEHFKGKLVGICANQQALFEGVRFVDEDMNRIWFPSIIDKIKRTASEDLKSSERQEIKELLGILKREIPDESESEYPVIFVDVHSFSSQGEMFAITARKQNHIDLLSSMHVPMIFGIEEALRGTTLRYFQDVGYITFALEGGNHQNKLTVTNNTAALMLLVASAGNLPPRYIPDYKDYKRHLVQENKQLPSSVKFIYQHIIEDGDDFKMRPGYTNFQPVKKGEWLANDVNGQIRAQCDGFILMPLYQKQGDDGFFIVREQV
ncbi:succinylglutamate desuccinylase/aspartoacylase family protein [Aliifodinibius sp. S!AR15-10]|uniref:succinylglutamate desuccinylase/aspartoacylase domain-containing protein n=1 Tax=Aliifodinibius sp. S!AR15-10 TaxID=2950437 RepID=UPI00285FA45F|nr:succinylglutamate desuccinylase/aspartoacylase family protein [Aliifodinibius sp. S!AR15-10]MDR8392831.1 succinylglutamate desuccinylase/aspartoacylase family protein [Aliifodinibius sp. S!AR15-10]